MGDIHRLVPLGLNGYREALLQGNDLDPPEVLPPVQMPGLDAVGNGAAPAGEIPVRDMIRLQLDKGLVRLDLGRHIPPAVHPYLNFIFNGI